MFQNVSYNLVTNVNISNYTCQSVSESVHTTLVHTTFAYFPQQEISLTPHPRPLKCFFFMLTFHI